MPCPADNTSHQHPWRVCVFGSSSKSTPQWALDQAHALGTLIAKKQLVCVNGGGMFGVMGAVNRGTREAGGRIIGVIHESFLVDVKVDHAISELVVTRGNDLNERKQLLFDNSDCFLIMPGGLGTLDELFDGLCAKGLNMKGLARKPVVIVNIDGFYDGTVAQLQRCEQESVLYQKVGSFVHVATTVEEALLWAESELQARGELVESSGGVVARVVDGDQAEEQHIQLDRTQVTIQDGVDAGYSHFVGGAIVGGAVVAAVMLVASRFRK